MAHTIAIAHHKGGVGKTTTTLNLGGALALLGYRVLVVDLDPQINLTVRLAVQAPAPTLAAVLTAPRGSALFDQAPRPVTCVWNPDTPAQVGFDLVPGDLAMAEVELALGGMQIGRERRLAKALAPLQAAYDFILIDCPPSLSLLMVNALYAAEGVLITVQAQDAAYQMLPWTINMIASVQEEERAGNHPQPVEVFGFVVTMTERTRPAREVEEQLRAQYGAQVFQTTIPRLPVELAVDSRWQAPVGVYAPDGPGARAYRALAEEVIARAAA